MKLIKSKWNRLYPHPETAPTGAFVCITWKPAYQEWHVWPSWAIQADYFTSDAEDAVNTANTMITMKLDAEHRAIAPADCVCSACVGHIG